MTTWCAGGEREADRAERTLARLTPLACLMIGAALRKGLGKGKGMTQSHPQMSERIKQWSGPNQDSARKGAAL